MIELPGAAYLYNLSLLAATVAVVSALVMVVRETMGGKLSKFDVYLLTTYISLGFHVARLCHRDFRDSAAAGRAV